MTKGCEQEIFTIQNGPYFQANPHTSAGYAPAETTIRVSYEGCDYLRLPASKKIPNFFDGGMFKFPSVSNQILFRCKIEERDRLFYVNKAEHTVLEIHNCNIEGLEYEATRHMDTKLIDYQPVSIPLDQIKSIADSIKYPPLHTNARRAKNIEIKLTEKQRRETLMMMDDHNVNFRNTSYTYAFQAYLAKYMHESMHEKVEIQLEMEHQRHSNSEPSRWQKFKHAINNFVWTTPEAKLKKIEAMQEWALQLHRLSTRFKAFDLFINHRGPNPQKTLNDLKTVLTQYEEDIHADLDALIQNISETDSKYYQKKQILIRLKQQLDVGITQFKHQLDQLGHNPTKEQIDRLVSITDRDSFIRSLGGFMQIQMTHILRAGIQVTYKISNQRLNDVIQVPRLIAHLSDAKHLMLIKGQSIVEGPKDNDTYSAIPEGMLDATTDTAVLYYPLSALTLEECKTLKELTGSQLTKIENIDVSLKDYKKLSFTDEEVNQLQALLEDLLANGNNSTNQNNSKIEPLREKISLTLGPKWFSIKPYLNKWNPAVVDKVLCLITGHAAQNNNRHGNRFYHWLVQPLKFLASIPEIIFSIPRLVLIVTLGILEALFSIFTWQQKSMELKLTFQLNQWIKQFYDDMAFLIAPLTYLKRSSWNAYKRNDVSQEEAQQGAQQTGQQEVLDACTDNTTFCYQLFVYFTPQLISNAILDFFSAIYRQIINIPGEVRYLISFDQQAEDTYELVKYRHESIQKLNEILFRRLQNARNSKNIQNAKNAQSLHPTQNSHHNKDLQIEHYKPLSYCTINHMSSPLDVFYEVLVTLSNGVVNPMFRKSPGIATFFFAVSMSTLATYLLPAPAIAWLKAVPAWLQYPVDRISLHFTGKSTTLGLQEQVVACFLEWKLGFFATEFGVELAHGHFEIFEPLFEDSEQIVLGLFGLIGLGMGLQYIPKLPTTISLPGLPNVPNYYFMVINVFTEEARECAEGTVILTSIEYGFLGLKFAMLMHSMLSGSESRQSLTDLQKIVLACGQQSFFKQIMRALQDENLKDCFQDKAFVMELSKALSNPDQTIFDSSSSFSPKIKTIAAVLTRVVDQILADQHLEFDSNEINIFKTALAQQLLEMPGILSLNKATEKVKESFSRNNPMAKSTPIEQSTLTLIEAYQKLCAAISLTKTSDNQVLFSAQGFGLISEASQYYDYVNDCFDAYNQALDREYGNHKDYATLYLDKRAYLDIFFNKYCNQPSNNLIRSLSYFLYPLTVFLRGLRFLSARITHKPCAQHQIVKNFCEDVVVVSQVIAPFARMTADFNLYMTGTKRFGVFNSFTYRTYAIPGVFLFL